MNTAIIMDMMFNTEMIVKDMKGGKEDMTENKRFTTKNIICSNYCVWDNNDKPYGNDEVVELLNALHEENEQLKQENQRMTDKLNQLALEFLNYDMVTMGKATEMSEMSYYDFLKYRKENGNPMELKE